MNETVSRIHSLTVDDSVNVGALDFVYGTSPDQSSLNDDTSW